MTYIRSQRGVALYLSIIVAGLIAFIAVAVSTVSFVQLNIVETSTESQYAFYAANSGVECAAYWDAKHDAFPSPEATDEGEGNDDKTGQMDCAQGNLTVVDVIEEEDESPQCDPDEDGDDETCDKVIFKIDNIASTPGGTACVEEVVVMEWLDEEDNDELMTTIISDGHNRCGSGVPAARLVERTVRADY